MIPKWISLVGSGGKTSLLYALGRQLAGAGRRVLLTTTTHLAMPVPPDIVCYEGAEGDEVVPPASGQPLLWGIPNGAGRREGPGVEGLAQVAGRFDHILCEADGARGLPLKWHGDHEPCLMPQTQSIYYVAGLTGLGQPAGQVLHRWEQSPYAKDHTLDRADVLALLLRGLAHMDAQVPVQVVLNQGETPERAAQGAWLVEQLGRQGYTAQVCAIQKEGYSIAHFDSRSR